MYARSITSEPAPVFRRLLPSTIGSEAIAVESDVAGQLRVIRIGLSGTRSVTASSAIFIPSAAGFMKALWKGDLYDETNEAINQRTTSMQEGWEGDRRAGQVSGAVGNLEVVKMRTGGQDAGPGAG